MNRLVEGKVCAVYTQNAQYKSFCVQRAAGEAFIATQKHKGWVLSPDEYDDNGYSGTTLDRPALQRLIGDIKAGKIDIVVIDRLQRVARSLVSFSDLMGIFEVHNVSLVCVDQDFDTGRSMVRLITEDFKLMPEIYEARA